MPSKEEEDQLVEKLMEMFKQISQEELEKNLKSRTPARRVAAALVIAAKHGKERLAKLFSGMKPSTTASTVLGAARIKMGAAGTAVAAGVSSLISSARAGAAGAGAALGSVWTGLTGYFSKEKIEAFFRHTNRAYVARSRYMPRPPEVNAVLNAISARMHKKLSEDDKKKIKESISKLFYQRRYTAGSRYMPPINTTQVRKKISDVAARLGRKLSEADLKQIEASISKLFYEKRYSAGSRYKPMVKIPSWPKTPKAPNAEKAPAPKAPNASSQPETPGISSPPNNKNMATVEEIENFVKNIPNVNARSQAGAKLKANMAQARAVIRRLQGTGSRARLAGIYGVNSFSEAMPLTQLLSIRRQYVNKQVPGLEANLNRIISNKIRRSVANLSVNFDENKVATISRAIRNDRSNAFPGKREFLEGLRRALETVGNRGNYQSAASRLQKIIRAAKNTNLRNLGVSAAVERVERLRKNEIRRRRENGWGQGQGRSYGNLGQNRGFPVTQEYGRPARYGNVRPLFEPEPNRTMPGVAGPMKLPPPPFPSIPVNERSPAPEMFLPPTEAAAVTNAGGANKALNLVENAGGVTNVVRTANLMRQVGNNPNAAIAAGANAKNVKIVLQLGGANNALKVASAVPALKKRRKSRKSKPKKALPKPPRVKEIKKLIKYLGTKANLLRRLPNKENKEKKLTKNQVVSKITRHLLRKN